MVNRLILVGRLGADPELKETGTGRSRCKLRIATDRTYRDAQDTMRKETTWFSVSVFGKQAEICDRFLEKGRSVYVEGRVRTWKCDDGTYGWDVKADTVTFLPGGGGGQSGKSKGHVNAEPAEGDNDDLPF